MKELFYILFVLAIIVGVGALKCSNYNECRTKFSTFYCTTH